MPYFIYLLFELLFTVHGIDCQYRRTGKDVLAGKALPGGLEDFSALFSDNTGEFVVLFPCHGVWK